MEIQIIANWHFPQTTNKAGVGKSSRFGKHDVKEVIVVKTDLFNGPTLLMSDMHTHTKELASILNDFFHLDKLYVIAAGDMAGNGYFGSDGDPTFFYKQMNGLAKEFYYVQGNHDLPSSDQSHKTYGYLPEGGCISTDLGKIGSVHGIISNRSHPYKTGEALYLKQLDTALNGKPDILVTHDTPALEKFYDAGRHKKYIGKESIYDAVKGQVLVHVYGHCHHPRFYHFAHGTHFINVDARIVLCVPSKDSVTDFIKSEEGLHDIYVHYES